MPDCLIINTGVGNFEAIKNVLKHIGLNAKVSEKNENFDKYKFIIIPGIGSFDSVMKNLKDHDDFFKLTKNSYIKEKKILGICAGMQVLFNKSEEGMERGLGLIQGQVKKFDDKKNRVPHMGWNKVRHSKSHPLWHDIPDNSRFYFVHSYYVKPGNANDVVGESTYPEYFTAALAKQNIFAVQFHPEKSQTVGLQLYKNFLTWDGGL